MDRTARVSDQIVGLIVVEESGVTVLDGQNGVASLQIGRGRTAREHALHGQGSAVVAASF